MRLRFGDYSFDQETRELFRAAMPVGLSARARELLALLLDRRPESVARDYLRRALWPDGPPAEGRLQSLVLELRGVIEERGGPEAIRKTTGPEGYAFVEEAAEDRREIVLGAGFRFFLLWDDREIALSDGDSTIGRDYDAGVRVDDAKVSRRHARITVDGDRATLEDLNSGNGTFHNGSRVKAVILADGDRITVGRVHLIFRSRAVLSVA